MYALILAPRPLPYIPPLLVHHHNMPMFEATDVVFHNSSANNVGTDQHNTTYTVNGDLHIYYCHHYHYYCDRWYDDVWNVILLVWITIFVGLVAQYVVPSFLAAKSSQKHSVCCKILITGGFAWLKASRNYSMVVSTVLEIPGSIFLDFYDLQDEN